MAVQPALRRGIFSLTWFFLPTPLLQLIGAMNKRLLTNVPSAGYQTFGVQLTAPLQFLLPAIALITPLACEGLLLHRVAAEPLLGSRQFSGRRQPAPQAEHLPKTKIILPDAFELLQGERPDFAASAAAATTAASSARTVQQSLSTGWSLLIAASTLTDEIKNAELTLRKITATQTAYSRSVSSAIDSFSLVAVAFGLIAVHDDREGDIRSSWKQQAAGLRDRFARAASACDREGSKAYDAARAGADDLAALIRGEPITAESDESPPFKWSQLCDRAVLMRRIDKADKALTTGTATAESMEAALEQLQREAEMIAVLGELIVQKEFIDWDDDAYRKFASTMRDEAEKCRRALSEKKTDSARLAAKSIKQSCSTCHDEYR